MAPVGRPEAEKEMDCGVPETREAVIVFGIDEPWATDLFPPLVTVKSKPDGGGGGVELPGISEIARSLMYSSILVYPSPLRSRAASEALKGLRPRADSQLSGIPSRSESGGGVGALVRKASLILPSEPVPLRASATVRVFIGSRGNAPARSRTESKACAADCVVTDGTDTADERFPRFLSDPPW